jgi:outer membrane protein TolC
MLLPACSPCRRHPTAWASSVALLLGCFTALAVSAPPDPAVPAPATPQGAPQGEPKLTLVECLRIANERQPTLAAARASLQAKLAAKRGVDELNVPRLFAPDLPIRRQQSLRGLDAANAELYQAEYDTAYAVIRMYYTAVYAGQQMEVASGVVKNLDAWRELIQGIVNQGADRNLNQDTVNKLTVYLRLAEARQAEAVVGAERGIAALREAMGVGADCGQFGPFRPADTRMPEPTVEPKKDEIIALALARRGELVQALVAADVTRLEICAQSAFRMKPSARTFAAGSDIHAKSLPTGLSNGEYRPGAVGIEMPTTVAGNREARMDQVRGYASRAEAVVEKTRGLITLEAENAFENWVQATRQVNATRDAARLGRDLAERARKNRAEGNIKPEDVIQTEVLAGQAQASYYEALYHQILALASLERITAGGFNAGIVPVTINPAP